MPSLLINGDPVLTKAIFLFVGHCSTIFAGSFSKLSGNFVGVHTPVVPVSDGRILLDLLLLLLQVLRVYLPTESNFQKCLKPPLILL